MGSARNRAGSPSPFYAPERGGAALGAAAGSNGGYGGYGGVGGAPGAGRHVPFRDSKLTQLLRASLSGGAKTTLVVCVGPSPVHATETMASLSFAMRATVIRAPLPPKSLVEGDARIDYKALALRQQIVLDALATRIRSGEGLTAAQRLWEEARAMVEGAAAEAEEEEAGAETGGNARTVVVGGGRKLGRGKGRGGQRASGSSGHSPGGALRDGSGVEDDGDGGARALLLLRSQLTELRQLRAAVVALAAGAGTDDAASGSDGAGGEGSSLSPPPGGGRAVAAEALRSLAEERRELRALRHLAARLGGSAGRGSLGAPAGEEGEADELEAAEPPPGEALRILQALSAAVDEAHAAAHTGGSLQPSAAALLRALSADHAQLSAERARARAAAAACHALEARLRDAEAANSAGAARAHGGAAAAGGGAGRPQSGRTPRRAGSAGRPLSSSRAGATSAAPLHSVPRLAPLQRGASGSSVAGSISSFSASSAFGARASAGGGAASGGRSAGEGTAGGAGGSTSTDVPDGTDVTDWPQQQRQQRQSSSRGVGPSHRSAPSPGSSRARSPHTSARRGSAAAVASGNGLALPVGSHPMAGGGMRSARSERSERSASAGRGGYGARGAERQNGGMGVAAQLEAMRDALAARDPQQWGRGTMRAVMVEIYSALAPRLSGLTQREAESALVALSLAQPREEMGARWRVLAEHPLPLMAAALGLTDSSDEPQGLGSFKGAHVRARAWAEAGDGGSAAGAQNWAGKTRTAWLAIDLDAPRPAAADEDELRVRASSASGAEAAIGGISMPQAWRAPETERESEAASAAPPVHPAAAIATCICHIVPHGSDAVAALELRARLAAIDAAQLPGVVSIRGW